MSLIPSRPRALLISLAISATGGIAMATTDEDYALNVALRIAA